VSFEHGNLFAGMKILEHDVSIESGDGEEAAVGREVQGRDGCSKRIDAIKDIAVPRITQMDASIGQSTRKDPALGIKPD
jgi:hypothetical protein